MTVSSEPLWVEGFHLLDALLGLTMDGFEPNARK